MIKKILIKINLFLFLVTSACVLFTTQSAYSQLLINQDFTGGTVGNSATAAPINWTTAGAGNGTFLIANTTPLVYAGYNSTRGNYLNVIKSTTGTISIGESLNATTTATSFFYYSFLFKASTASATSTFFASLDVSMGTGNNFAKIFAQSAGGGYNLGISKSAAAGVYNGSPTLLTFGTTYLVMVKYVYNSGTLNDEAYLFINPLTTTPPANGSAESSDLSATTDGSILSSNGVFAIRNAVSSPNCNIDGIRVGLGSTSANAFTALAPADLSPPVNTATFPKTANITTTSVNLVSNLDEAGTTYYVLLPASGTAPSVAQVKAGQDGNGAAAFKSGNFGVAANTNTTASITGLTPSTAYKIYVVSQDVFSPPNIQSALVSLSFSTGTPQAGTPFSGAYPFTNTASPTPGPASGTTDPTPVPTATGLTFGSFKSNGVSANPNANSRFSYTGWTTGATNASNTFTGAIDLTDYYDVTVTPNAGMALDISSLNFTVERSGTGIRQYVVRGSLDGYTTNLPASISPLNANLSVVATNVFQVADNTGSYPGNTVTPGATYTNLMGPVTFRFYAYNAEAAGGTFSIDDVNILGSTYVADVTAPATTGGYPLLSNVTTTSVIVTNNISENGTTYYSVVPASGVSPATSEQVRNGQDGNGNPAVVSGSFLQTANTNGAAGITGLSPGIVYNVFVVSSDAAPAPNLQSTFTTLNFTTLQLTQTITFASSATKTYGDADFNPGASSTNNSIPITYTTSNPAVATIIANQVHIVAAGTVIIYANQAGNVTYSAAAQQQQTLTINQRALLVTATASNKIYDGLTAATPLFSDNRIPGDVFTINFASADFNNKNAGISKTVTITGISLTGASAANYSPNSTASATADITPRALTISATGINKIYDGNNAATVTLSDNRVTGDVLTTSHTAAAFSNENVGAAKPVSVTGISISGADAGNYTFNTTASATADITARALTVSAAGINKIYDGNNAATATLSDNRVAGDVLTTSYTAAAFSDENVGAAKPVSVTGISISGADAGNYTFNTTASATADITARALTISASGINKIYDGNNAATVTLSDNRVAGDVLTTSYTAAAFSDENVGAAKPVFVTGISISGADAGNYTFNTTASATADITARALTISATGINKVYDGNNSAAVTLSDNRVAGDVLTTSYTAAAFSDENVGAAKPVSVTGISISGADAGNYTFNTTASATADITARALTISAAGINKVYDGNNAATVTLSDNRVAGDVLTTSYTAAAFSDENVGAAKPVSVTGISISGADAGNYTFNTTASATADITARALTISAVGINKVYDGNNAATVTLSDNRVAGDVLTTSYTAATFSDKNVGAAKPVSVTGISISGADAGNYTFNTTASAAANITARALTISAAGINKVYDGNNAATVTLSDNRVAGDVLTTSYTAAAFSDKNVGAAKPVSVTGISISGTDAGNYTFNTTASATADITARPITVTADAKTKVYGTADPALTYTLSSPLVSGDSFTGSLSRAPGENAGTYQISQGTLALNSNYSLSYVSANLTITSRPITVTADAKTKFYGTADPALTYTFSSPLVSGDSFTGSLSRAPGENAGTYQISQGTLALNSNYTLSYIAASLIISKGNLTVTADNQTKVSGSANPPLTVSITGFVNGDTRASLATQPTATTSAVTASPPGNYSIIPSSAASANYNFSYVNGTLTVTAIPNQPPTIAAINNQVVCYTAVTQVISLAGITSGTEPGQTVTLSINTDNPGFFTILETGNITGSTGTITYRLAPGVSGFATVTVTAKDNGGTFNGGVDTFTRQFTINVNPAPVAEITSNSGSTISKGNIAILNASGGVSYTWSAPGGIVNGQNTSSLTVRPAVTTLYTVTVTNSSGCSSSASYLLNVEEDYRTVIPNNLISPNGDGINDQWVVKNLDMYPNNEVQIFDRAEQILYTKKNYDNSWEGTYRGLPLAEGTYFYRITFGPGKLVLKGYITILKQ